MADHPGVRDVAGVWFRQVPAGADPLHVPDPAPSARWQDGTVVGGLYLADSPETAWAEWYRALAERGLPPTRPRDLWRIAVDAHGVADLSTPDTLAGLGLPTPRPDHRDRPPFQAAGHALCAAGHPGLIAPPAARPSGLVLCLFRRPGASPPVRALGPPERHRTPPIVPRGMTT